MLEYFYITVFISFFFKTCTKTRLSFAQSSFSLYLRFAAKENQ